MAKKAASKQRATAETMAAKQREISVSEFFAKNRHLLGFDNPRKALLTTVKEAVDNALDACEEAEILPDITVVIEDLQPDRPASAKSSKYRVTIADNGPGIVRKQVEHIFGRLLYGSKFHRLKMSRGQQGIGISAAGMYGLLTTGKPMVIHTRTSPKAKAHHIELAMNTKTNRAEVTVDTETDDFPPARFRELTAGTRELALGGEFLPVSIYATGTSVTVELEGQYRRGRGSVDEFLELTAIANPHARIVFVPPTKAAGGGADDEDGPTLAPGASESGGVKPDSAVAPSHLEALAATNTTEHKGVIIYPRGTAELPPETQEIMPHPKGIELGMLLQMLRDSEHDQKNPTIASFLSDRFSRVSPATASKLCADAKIPVRTKVGAIDHAKAEALFKAMQATKLPNPPTNCLAPIGVKTMLAGMVKGVQAEFYTASTRVATVYRGRPFLIECAIAFGGNLPGDQSARVIRFANRVPLLYQQSACSSFKAVTETAWKNYGLQQPRGGAPVGPLVVMIHMASVWVPFTSESKEAIADYDEIRKEMKLALQECGRKLGQYVRRRQRMKREGEKRDVFERYIGEIAKACHAITGSEIEQVYNALLEQARARTEIADAQLDEEGRFIKDEHGRLAKDDDVVIIGDNGKPVIAPADLPDKPRPEGSGPTKPKSNPTKSDPPTPAARKKKKVVKKIAKKRQTKPTGAALFGDD
ncbi:MAG: DNA topoisomerase VI subunit B [Phycisphaerales bacterium]|nr:DNA topoisomerase VI subunit B [Planctomycetota bacterium]MCH8507568.1 DNA topoisomerase VI subunit B [Phycisphaerales bacterium]